MNLAAVLNVLKWLTIAVAVVLGIFAAVCLINRAVKFSKCASDFRDFKRNKQHKSVYGKVIYRKALKSTALCRNLYEVTAVYHVEEKEYRLTELSVGRAYPLDEFIEIEYDIDCPENARLKNGTDLTEYQSCIGKSIAEIILIAAGLFFCPIAIGGIFMWIDFIIRFVYELAGGVPYNL